MTALAWVIGIIFVIWLLISFPAARWVAAALVLGIVGLFFYWEEESRLSNERYEKRQAEEQAREAARWRPYSEQTLQVRSAMFTKPEDLGARTMIGMKASFKNPTNEPISALTMMVKAYDCVTALSDPATCDAIGQDYQVIALPLPAGQVREIERTFYFDHMAQPTKVLRLIYTVDQVQF